MIIFSNYLSNQLILYISDNDFLNSLFEISKYTKQCLVGVYISRWFGLTLPLFCALTIRDIGGKTYGVLDKTFSWLMISRKYDTIMTDRIFFIVRACLLHGWQYGKGKHHNSRISFQSHEGNFFYFFY